VSSTGFAWDFLRALKGMRKRRGEERWWRWRWWRKDERSEDITL
jgi:hypothetical protein